MKQCKQCKKELDDTYFYHHASTKDKLMTICKECHGLNDKKRREKDPLFKEKAKGYMKKFRSNPDNKRKIISSAYKTKYGITLEEYEQILKEQNNCCYICNIEEGYNNKPLYVDHCHSSGKIRRLLCQHCNTGLGMFKDNPELLIKAADYLKEQHGRTKLSVA